MMIKKAFYRERICEYEQKKTTPFILQLFSLGKYSLLGSLKNI